MPQVPVHRGVVGGRAAPGRSARRGALQGVQAGPRIQGWMSRRIKQCTHLTLLWYHNIQLVHGIVDLHIVIFFSVLICQLLLGGAFLLASILPRYLPWRTQSCLTLVSISTWDSIQNPPSMCPPASFLLQSGKSGRCPRRRCWTRHLPNTRQPIKGLAKHTKC